METTYFFFAALLLGFPGAASSPAQLPPPLVAVQQFRGRMEYAAQHTDSPTAALVRGSYVVAERGWSLEESGPTWTLRAGSDENVFRSGAATLTFDDPLAVNPLANPWAAAMARIAGEQLSPADGSRRIWTGSTGLRVYLDPAEIHIIRISIAAPDTSFAFNFGDWTNAGGMDVPQTITRVRDGRADGSYFISDYRVNRTISSHGPLPVTALETRSAPAKSDSESAARLPTASVPLEPAWLQVLSTFGVLALALTGAAWWRRDALIAHLCRRLAADPRAWRDAGISAFVSAEGVLHFDGSSYRVGPEFYARSARVQTSPLFLRISARGTSRVVVLARKFRRSWPRRSRPPTRVIQLRGKVSAGFGLVEVMVAVTLFALVVVTAVYPTLVVLARADALAAQHATANRLAANALADQYAALSYGKQQDWVQSSTAVVDGMNVKVDWGYSPTYPDTINVFVTVSSADKVLARLATTVGPPVPTPAAGVSPP